MPQAIPNKSIDLELQMTISFLLRSMMKIHHPCVMRYALCVMSDDVTCWICGGKADSREHMIKASDLRSVFGSGISQASPLYLHDERNRNHPVGGIKSKKLKYSQLLCSSCNNERTQSHDYAWEQLSKYLRNHNPPLSGGDTVKLARVFPGRVRSSMLAVHLFFLKQFGCLIAENDIPLALKPFSEAILNETPHPNVHIAFWVGLNVSGRIHVGRTQVHTAQLGGLIVYAGWFYAVEPIAVNVIYAVPEEYRKGLISAWHPSNIGEQIVMVAK